MSRISIHFKEDHGFGKDGIKIPSMPIPEGLHKLDTILRDKYGVGVRAIMDGAGPKHRPHSPRTGTEIDPELRRIMRRRRGI